MPWRRKRCLGRQLIVNVCGLSAPRRKHSGLPRLVPSGCGRSARRSLLRRVPRHVARDSCAEVHARLGEVSADLNLTVVSMCVICSGVGYGKEPPGKRFFVQVYLSSSCVTVTHNHVFMTQQPTYEVRPFLFLGALRGRDHVQIAPTVFGRQRANEACQETCPVMLCSPDLHVKSDEHSGSMHQQCCLPSVGSRTWSSGIVSWCMSGAISKCGQSSTGVRPSKDTEKMRCMCT